MSHLNKSDYTLLGLLSRSDYSGYEAKRFITKTSSFYGSESNAQIYPVLKKLESQKLVRANLDKSSGARNKVIYSITKKGREKLLDWLESDCELTIHREEFLLQLSLSQHLTKEKLARKIAHYQQSIVKKMEKLEEILQHIKIDHVGKADQKGLLLTYNHIKILLEAKLKWCDQITKSTLKK